MSDNLCEELMVEILTRLPPKSLLRFRSVSKSLCSCIDTCINSPDFIRMHTCRSPQRILLTHRVKRTLKYKRYRNAAFCTLHAKEQLPLPLSLCTTPVVLPRRKATPHGSCNGILLLSDAVYGCGNGNGVISLWNPSIMRQLTLPDCPLRRCSGGMAIGLGFDPITDDNKVVSIPAYGNTRILKSSFVYAMKTGAWHPIDSPMPLYFKVLSRARYLNGVLHWVVERYSTDSNYIKLGYIMTFDLSSHVFGMLDLPKPGWKTQELATIQGSLAVISSVSNDSWIWVRGETNDSWSVVSKLKTEDGAELRKVLELTNNGDLLLDVLLKKFYVYTPKTGALSTLADFNDASSLVDMDAYVETLQLFHIGTACEKATPLFLQTSSFK
ncbi:hypothetical protein Lser_V15G11461 [Lactuca serriola]